MLHTSATIGLTPTIMDRFLKTLHLLIPQLYKPIQTHVTLLQNGSWIIEQPIMSFQTQIFFFKRPSTMEENSFA